MLFLSMETLDMPLTRQQILCKALSLDPTEREELAEEIISEVSTLRNYGFGPYPNKN